MTPYEIIRKNNLKASEVSEQTLLRIGLEPTNSTKHRWVLTVIQVKYHLSQIEELSSKGSAWVRLSGEYVDEATSVINEYLRSVD